MCGLRRDGAEEQIGSSCFSRPIKLRVNLAPHMMEEGANPLEKNFAAAGSYLLKNMGGIITSSGLLLFSSVEEEEPEEKLPKVAEKYH